MAFELYQAEPLPTGIKRLLQEETDQIILKLSSSTIKHKSIHEARKSHKKIRAILRMVRPVVGETRFKQENTFYRDNARLLSDIRDATALLEAHDELNKKYKGIIPVNAIEVLNEALESHRTRQAREAIAQGEVTKQARRQIKSFQPITQDLPISANRFKLIQKGLVKVYRRGYAGLLRTHQDPCMEHLHDWRKRVKYLWYAISILSPVWPALMKPFATELKDLSDRQGLWRDLGLLQTFIEVTEHLDWTKEEAEAVIEKIHLFRQELLTGSFDIAFRIYRENPASFIYRLKGYWKEWKNFSPPQNPNLLHYLLQIEDPRDGTNIRHLHSHMLLMVILANLKGHFNYSTITRFLRQNKQALNTYLEPRYKLPGYSSIRRFIKTADFPLLSRQIHAWYAIISGETLKPNLYKPKLSSSSYPDAYLNFTTLIQTIGLRIQNPYPKSDLGLDRLQLYGPTFNADITRNIILPEA